MINFDMMKAAISIVFIFVLFIAAGCKPKRNDSITGGGKGGSSVITVMGAHHGSLLDTCMVYIKYGTPDAPANGIYDDSLACTLHDGTSSATFSGLTAGNYYFLAVGLHGSYSPPTVRGGKSCTISQQGSNVNIVVPTYQYNP